MIVVHVTRGSALRIYVVASTERLKSLFVNAKCTRTHCFRKRHVPNKFKTAIVLPTISCECATHLNCSQFFHTCLQFNNGSCGCGFFAMVKNDNFSTYKLITIKFISSIDETQRLVSPNGNGKGIYWSKRSMRASKNWVRRSFLILLMQSTLWVSVMVSLYTHSLCQKFWEKRANWRLKNWGCNWKSSSFLEVTTLLCLQLTKLDRFYCKRLFVGAFANSCYSMLGLRNVKFVIVKTIIYVSFVQKISGFSS